MNRRTSVSIFVIIVLSVVLSTTVSAAKSVEIKELRSEYFSNPLGINETHPRLSWILESNIENQIQSAYQVLVATSPSKLSEKKADLWNSQKLESDQSIQVKYAGMELSSRDICWWKVRVWDKDGKASAWSEPASF